MKMYKNEPAECAAKNNDQRSYEVPAVIYEGTITTRAGSPVGGGGEEGVDPADLFGTDN